MLICTNRYENILNILKNVNVSKLIQGDFFNWASPENVSRLPPPKFAWTGSPLNFLGVGIIFTSQDT